MVFPMDDAKLPVIWAEDIGRCAYGVFKAGDEFIGQTVGVAAEHLTGTEIAEALSEAFGQAITYNAVPADVYRSFGFPGADDIGNMFQFKRDFQATYLGHRNLDVCRRLNPELATLRAWLTDNVSRIPMPA